MTDLFEDLDSLYKDARRAFLSEKAKKEARKKQAAAPEAPPSVGDKYTNPDNWERRRAIALIHADTQTLLGNFSEWVHRTEPLCRKLIREDSLVAVSAVEQVSGSWWLPADQQPEPKQDWHTQERVFIPVFLDKLRINNPICELVVSLSYGGIARADLAEDTQFASAEQLVFLPAGTNVLNEMSLDSKIALRLALKQ